MALAAVLFPLGILSYLSLAPGMPSAKAEANPERAVLALPSVKEGDNEEEALLSAPKVRTPAEAGIGRLIPDVSVVTVNGAKRSLSELSGRNGLVIAVVSPTCPVSQKLSPALGRAEAAATGSGFGFLYLAPTATDTVDELKQAAVSGGWKAPVAKDDRGTIAATLGAASTTEVFVLDAARTLVYRGALSDQYGPTWAKPAPTHTYLQDALQAVGQGKRPAVSATTAPGCLLDLETGAASVVSLKEVTYHNRISRIVQENCVECHRTGGIAPFSLERYEDIIAHAGMIRAVVQQGQMPPWFAEKPAKDTDKSHTPWANDRSLSAQDKSDLLGWLVGNKAVGNPKDAPMPRKFSEDGWSIGKPDAVFAFPKPVSVKAEGTMPYQFVDVPTNFKEDVWVDGIEVQPGNRSVVHHVLVFVREPGASRAADLGETGGSFGIYVPGFNVLDYPAGFAKKIPAGAVIRFQMHYTPNGKATEDTTRVGFRFARTQPKHEVKVAGISSMRLRIPPGAENHPETATIQVPADVKVLAFLPHMHVRAKACKYVLTTPDGKQETLLNIPRYDFNWQLYYRLKEPLEIRKGSTVEFTGWYDNSANNPANPDPTKLVRWGPQTTDEMLLGYVEYYVPGPLEADDVLQREGRLGAALRERLGNRPGNGAAPNGQNLEAAFKRFDRNGDGRLTPDELPREQLFQLLDENGDGFVTLEEAKKRFPNPGGGGR
ncbi:MAG: redoxin domain-containing protein [Armatimonadaceae bacterium]